MKALVIVGLLVACLGSTPGPADAQAARGLSNGREAFADFDRDFQKLQKEMHRLGRRARGQLHRALSELAARRALAERRLRSEGASRLRQLHRELDGALEELRKALEGRPDDAGVVET